MGILHPGITQSSLVLRSEKNPPVRLSILEFDGNFVYLEDLALGISQSISGLASIPAGGTAGQVLAKTSGNDYDFSWVDQTGGGGGGTNGTSGVSGIDGTDGTSGTSGINGIDGTSGVNGIDGTDGTSGIDGTSGVNGADGTSGVNGADGTSGVNGDSGTSGTSGVNGAVGATFEIIGIYPDYSTLTQSVGNINSLPTPNYMDSYLVIDTAHVWTYAPTASLGLTPSVANDEGWVDLGAIAGPQGLSGTSGINGTSGVSGLDGTSGINGTDGTSGVSGTSGTSGVNGVDGAGALNSVNNIFELDLTNSAIFDISNPIYSNPMYWDRTSGDLLNINTVGQFGYATYSNSTATPLADNESYEIPFHQITGEFVSFLGSTYSSFWVNSNSYITFGAPSSATTIIAPGQVNVPAIFIGAGDNSINKLVYGYDDPTVSGVGLTAHSGTEDLFRVRFIGNQDSNGSSDTNSLQWELRLYKSDPTWVSIVVETAPATGLTYRSPGGIWGISDGSNWIERISGLPTFDERFGSNLNTISIHSMTASSGIQYSEQTSAIKFIGPGVYKYTSGSEGIDLQTIVNIDPLGQYGIGVNYDTYQSALTAPASVISANRYDLRLTTGRDGSAVRIRPRGKAIIAPYNRIPNQSGDGYNVEITSSNAAASPTQSNYNGGSVIVRPGLPVGTGSTGSVYIGLPTSNTFMSGTTFLDSVYVYDANIDFDTYRPGWTGTYSTLEGLVATVVKGIIVDVS